MIRVLIVEDCVELLEPFEELVKIAVEKDVAIETTTDGENALALIKNKAFDLVITDMELIPGKVNGVEVATQAIACGYPVIGMSADERPKNLSAKVFLKKPFRLSELKMAIDTMLP